MPSLALQALISRRATPLFIISSLQVTLFARRLPVPLVWHLWTLLLRGGKPYRIMFFGIALLLRHKAQLMSLPSESLPGTLVRLAVGGAQVRSLSKSLSHSFLSPYLIPISSLSSLSSLSKPYLSPYGCRRRAGAMRLSNPLSYPYLTPYLTPI